MAEVESIRALATVTLDARALEQLGPQTIDRLADLVAARLAERRAGDEDRCSRSASRGNRGGASGDGAQGDPPWRARSGRIPGQRPRVRRSDLDEWIAAGGRRALIRGSGGGFGRGWDRGGRPSSAGAR